VGLWFEVIFPSAPRQTVRAVFPHTAFRLSSSCSVTAVQGGRTSWFHYRLQRVHLTYTLRGNSSKVKTFWDERAITDPIVQRKMEVADSSIALRTCRSARPRNPDLSRSRIGSERPNDAEICHKLGAECLMTKPDSYASWVETMDRVLGLMLDSPLKK